MRTIISNELESHSKKRENYYKFLQERKQKLKLDQDKIDQKDPTIIELIFSMLEFEKENRKMIKDIKTSLETNQF